jgi:hypothetical protein
MIHRVNQVEVVCDDNSIRYEDAVNQKLKEGYRILSCKVNITEACNGTEIWYAAIMGKE